MGFTSQLWYGSEKDDTGTVVADITKSTGINVLMEYEFIRVRAVYHTLNFLLEAGPVTLTDDKLTYIALAFMADVDPFIWRSEYTQVDAKYLNTTEKSAYGSIGYMIGPFTPHYTYSYWDSIKEYTSHTVGVRWDFTPGAALKIEYTNQDYTSDGGQTLVEYVEPGAYRLELFSLALDFVF